MLAIFIYIMHIYVELAKYHSFGKYHLYSNGLHFACVCFLACQVWFDYASLWFKGRPENQGSKVLQGTENAGKNKSIILAMSNPLLYI